MFWIPHSVQNGQLAPSSGCSGLFLQMSLNAHVSKKMNIKNSPQPSQLHYQAVLSPCQRTSRW